MHRQGDFRGGVGAQGASPLGKLLNLIYVICFQLDLPPSPYCMNFNLDTHTHTHP